MRQHADGVAALAYKAADKLQRTGTLQSWAQHSPLLLPRRRGLPPPPRSAAEAELRRQAELEQQEAEKAQNVGLYVRGRPPSQVEVDEDDPGRFRWHRCAAWQAGGACATMRLRGGAVNAWDVSCCSRDGESAAWRGAGWRRVRHERTER